MTVSPLSIRDASPFADANHDSAPDGGDIGGTTKSRVDRNIASTKSRRTIDVADSTVARDALAAGARARADRRLAMVRRFHEFVGSSCRTLAA
jgi:hypothetical protein